MSTQLFQAQLTEFLTEHPALCNRDIIIEDTTSLVVSRWKDLWIKTPEKEHWDFTRNGYLKAYALGYIDDVWIQEKEIILLHVEGIQPNKSHIPLLKELWDKMVKNEFILHDWHSNNIIMRDNIPYVIDWNCYTDQSKWAEQEFLEFLEYGLE